MTRSRALRTLAAATLLGGLALAGGASAAPEESETTFFLRADGCGEEQEAGRLSTEQGDDTSDGCGPIGGVPVDGVFYEAAGEPLTVTDYTTEDGVPLVLDAARDVQGVFALQSWTGTPGAGELAVDLVLTAKRTDPVTGKSKQVTLGEGTFSTTVLPSTATVYSIPFSFNVDNKLSGTLTSLTLTAAPHGLSLNANAQSYKGTSFVTIPTVVDDGAEAAARE